MLPQPVFLPPTMLGEITHDKIKTSRRGGDPGRGDRYARDGAASDAGARRLRAGPSVGERISLSLRKIRFLAGDVAAGVVGGAIGAAGAIASAPFRDSYVDDSYAYYRGSVPYDDSYAYYDRRPYPRTTCGLQLGATYLGPDGRWYPC